jgi:uncharacterized membrane protein
MGKGRLEAFSDGVIAVAITIMVLELKTPHEESLHALRAQLPTLISYILSFIYIGIYWTNHHHLFQAARHVSGMTLWANLHLLFWITLIPFATGWIDEAGFAAWPVAFYGLVLLMAAFAWQILAAVLVRCHGPRSPIGAAIGRGTKEWLSTVLYITGIALALSGALFSGPERWTGIAGFLTYTVVAALWFIPDRRIERALRDAEHRAAGHH